MSRPYSLFLVILLPFLWIFPLNARENLKRFIVKRAGKVAVEYHQKNPYQKIENHLSADLIASKSLDSSIEYAEEDLLLNTQFVKSEEQNFSPTRSGAGDQFQWQWSLGYGAGGIEVEDGWNESFGDSSVVIAVVDTGILNHQELAGRILSGYDFISDVNFANDGNGRDSDASDPGDWVTYGDSCFNGQTRNSSWHGTHVAGIIAANGDNREGMSGIDLRAKILPVRVLGKCGGYTSDIADGIRWAAGGQVAGVPNNSHPAKVINLSLGGRGACGVYMQEAINFARSRGTVVVVAAGNDGNNIDSGDYTPANCNGAIAVASNNQFGGRSGFSNYGKIIDITAPGGGQGGGILSLGNTGATTPSSMTYVSYQGTSMATPHVAAVAGLIAAVKAGLYPDQIEDILERGAKTFGFQSGCEDGSCGTGILNVLEALLLAKDTPPDANFRVDDEVVRSLPVSEANQFSSSHNGAGGFCGSIDFDHNSNSKGPRGNGPLSLIAIVFVFFLINKKFKFQDNKNRETF